MSKAGTVGKTRRWITGLACSPVALGTLSATGFYWLVVRLVLDRNWGDRWFGRVMADPINWGTLVAFGIAMWILSGRNRKSSSDEQALEELQQQALLPTRPEQIVSRESAEVVLRRLNGRDLDSKRRTPCRELLHVALSRAFTNWSAEDVGAAVNTRAELLQSKAESEYALVRYLAWAIPSIGFIGTVYGLGLAIGSLRSGGVELTQEQRLDAAVGYLYTAFDTTFVALVLSLVLMYRFYIIQAREDSVLSRSMEWCFDGFVLKMESAREESLV
ncbi:MAG: MotA/TolQ/ExbB proton channel family protein [Planctomycetes bacterium]|nr:MotA/TolQ/ExbB proton channel family protein [Planctomycetota bacterium]